jgi:hypothetical protein
MDLEYCNFKMARDIRGNGYRTKNRGLGSIDGLTVVFM